MKINGYTIKYNSYWTHWAVSIDDIGTWYFYALADAVEFAKRG